MEAKRGCGSSLEQELKVVMSCPLQVLGTKFRSSARSTRNLNCWAISVVPRALLLIVQLEKSIILIIFVGHLYCFFVFFRCVCVLVVCIYVCICIISLSKKASNLSVLCFIFQEHRRYLITTVLISKGVPQELQAEILKVLFHSGHSAIHGLDSLA